MYSKTLLYVKYKEPNSLKQKVSGWQQKWGNGEVLLK